MTVIKLDQKKRPGPNARDGYGDTPLNRAESERNFACARVLREHGAGQGDADNSIASILRKHGAGKALKGA